MRTVRLGDRVKILCASHLQDGTALESVTDRETPYWIRAGGRSSAAANDAVVGMTVGERKTLTIEVRRGRTMTLDIDVVGIRAPRSRARASGPLDV